MSSFVDRFDKEYVFCDPRGRALLLLVVSRDALLLLVPAPIVWELEVVNVKLVSPYQGYLPSAMLRRR